MDVEIVDIFAVSIVVKQSTKLKQLMTLLYAQPGLCSYCVPGLDQVVSKRSDVCPYRKFPIQMTIDQNTAADIDGIIPMKVQARMRKYFFCRVMVEIGHHCTIRQMLFQCINIGIKRNVEYRNLIALN